MRKATQIRRTSIARPLTIRVRLTADPGVGRTIRVSDVLLQAGGTASGWVPHVTELPWTAGIVGG